MFDHLKEYDPSSARAWLDMPELGAEARLLLAPAGESNQGYFNALLKLTGKRVRQLASRQVSVGDLKKNRDEDRKLFPRHVLVGWEKVETAEDRHRPAEEKEYVPFSAEHAAELCAALPDHLFDRIRNFASTPEQFYPEDELPPDAEELAKN